MVVQSKTIISLKIKRIIRLSSMIVEDSLFRYLRLCLLSMYKPMLILWTKKAPLWKGVIPAWIAFGYSFKHI